MSINLKKRLQRKVVSANVILSYCTPDEFPDVRGAVVIAKKAIRGNDTTVMKEAYGELDVALSAYQKEINLDAVNPSFSDYSRPCYGH